MSSRGVLSLFLHCCILLGSGIVSAFTVPASLSGSTTTSSTTTRLQLNIGDSWQEISNQVTTAAPSSSSFAGLTDIVGSGNTEPLILAGALVAVLAIGFSIVASSSSSSSSTKGEKTVESVAEPEPEPIDISIPYDAAIILAYKELRQEEPDVNSQVYAQFKHAYLEKAVAEVTLKQKARKLDEVLSAAGAP